jgi:ABC-type enterochelin transport system substrate-binding protein
MKSYVIQISSLFLSLVLILGACESGQKKQEEALKETEVIQTEAKTATIAKDAENTWINSA